MTNVFISYERSAEAVVRKVRDALTAAGHVVWTDAELPPHRAYADVIEERLGTAEAVLVLWSAAATRSQWVRAEAEFAREKGKLVQASLDDSLPPMPFNQTQCASLTGWRGGSTALGWKKVLASIDELGSGQVHAPPAPGAKRLRDGRALRRGLVIGLAACAVAAAAIAWRLWPAPHWTVENSRSFISTMALEGEPAFSPDGKTLAYTSAAQGGQRKIFTRNVAGGGPIKLTNDSYDDASPAWSPDGTRIAYIAVKPGAPCRIMVAAASGGEARQVGHCNRDQSSSVSWQRGTSFLYYVDRVGIYDCIFRLDLDSGVLQQLSRVRKPFVADMRHLEIAPDGKRLFYVGGRNASTDVMVLRDMTSGREKILNMLVGGGFATWSEDSRSLLASTASGIGSAITAYPLDGSKPYGIYTTTINVSRLAVGAGGSLAVETDTTRQNLARPRPQAAAQPDVIDPVNGKTWAPTFAPDGTLAFISNRSGANAIWMQKPGASPAILYDAGLAPLFRLQFSPDGTKLAVIFAGDTMNIKIITVDGATVSSFQVPSVGYANPTWTPDGKAINLLNIPTLSLIRIAIDNPAQRPTIVHAPWETLAYHGADIYTTRADTGGVWLYGPTPRLISSKYPRDYAPPMTFRGDDVLIPDFYAEGGARILAQPLAGGPDRVLGYAPGAEALDRFFESKMAVNPKTGDVVYVAAVQGDTNIDLLSLTKH